MFNGGWFRVDIVKEVGGEIVVLRERIDGIYARNHFEAFSKAFDRNPIKPGEFLATQAVTGWRNRKVVAANERRSRQIRELYEIMEKVR